jgi:outer membrane protein
MKYFLTIFISLFFFFNNVNADIPRFIDFSKVLNESIAGKKAQDDIKKSFTTESKKFDTTEKSLRESEAKLISQKKLITKEEYQKKANELRDKVSKFSKDRKKSIDAITKKKIKC